MDASDVPMKNVMALQPITLFHREFFMTATIATRFRDAVPLTKVSEFVPGHPHCATVWRWATKGVRGVRLATVMIGGRRMVTPEALEKFLQALNSEEPAIESGSEVSRRAREASQALERLGC